MKGTTDSSQSFSRNAPVRVFRAFLRLGMTAFGGPAMVAHIRELVVRKYAWVPEDSFQVGVALCQSIPGATAMQTAAYAGLKTAGIAGAVAAYTGFGLPAFVLMVFFAVAYEHAQGLPAFVPVFSGLRMIVVAIVAEAALSFGMKSLKDYRDVLLAIGVAAFMGVGGHPFVAVVVAILVAMVVYRSVGAVSSSAPEINRSSSVGKIGPAAFLWLSLLVVTLTMVFLFIVDRKLFTLAGIMLKVDLLAFGGGFASVPLMFHEVVDVQHWLDSRTFMDAIALGQVTPGPIVITATFVGYQVAGIAGAIVATFGIFTPSFVIVIASVPYLERLQSLGLFRRGLRGALACFVGLLFYVTLKFGLAAPWSVLGAIIFLVAFLALRSGVDIVWVVLAGVCASAILL